MKTIALANQKGGVGKTTTAASLGIGLSRQGKKVLLIDADAQGNLTQMLGWSQPDELSPTLSTLMEKIIAEQPITPGEGILHHPSGVNLVPANIELSALEVTLVNTMSRETVLRQYLSTVADRYDYALIDCMPSLGMLTINALTAADSVIIPVQAQYLPAKGLEQLLRTITRVKRQLNPKLEVDGIVLTMVDSRTTLAREINALVRKTYGGHVFASEIPRSIKAAEISVENKSIYDHDRSGKAALAYENLTREVLSLGKQITRTLTTECTAVLMPFKSQEIQDAGGIYYGVNAVSHNLIVCNRGNLLNGNGFITGVSGSGKSMAAKQEVSALALSTDHDIIIVDPEREYGELVRALGGEVITISASDPNGCHINALDLSEGYGDGKEPLVMKSEFIMSLYEQLMGADKIEPQEKSIIDRSVGNIYREYLKSYQGQPPTLKNLYDDLMKQVNPEAHRIALALELFTVGSLNVFSHQTNINTKSRILCFDIQDLGENLKSVGLLVMLDAIYNRVIQNRREGKYTHVYIDEIYLFFANGSGSGHSITNYSSEFLYKCWKRFRKYGATLTGITQNVEECLLSNTARMMFANSEFLLMLNQATTDREQLARLLGASDTQMSYVDNAPAGHGLIKVGGAIVPFANELPKNTELYRLMSTRPGEE